jgi:nucleoside-diphosphate-sugar epimerase
VKKVAITGASGFTGVHLARLLTERGYEVCGLVHDKRDRIDATMRYWVCDLLNENSLADALREIQPHKIVHLAAVSFVAHGNIEDIYRTNVVGTRNLLQAALKSDLSLEAVLIASSANIYGNQTSGVLTEKHPPRPANDYAVSKVAMEYVGQMYADRLPIITTRPFNYTGVGQSLNFLIPKIVDHVRRRADHIELGNLDIARDFSDVRALVAAYAGLIEQESAIGGTYNICSGRAYSLREIVEMAQELSGHSIEVRVNPAFVRDNDVKTLSGSRELLDQLIPGLPNPPLEETLRWMIDA